MASMVPAGEEAATTTTRRLTSTVWVGYTINRPADGGGALTATCLECGQTLCAGSNNGTSHLRRHTTTKRCQKLAAERVELGRRQPTSPPTTAAAEPSSPGNYNGDYYSPSPSVVGEDDEEYKAYFTVVVEDDEEDKDLFTVDGIYIPELYDKLIAEGLDNIERSNVPAVPPQAASSSTMWFIKKTKERQVKKAENRKRRAPDDESEQQDFNLRGERTT